MAEQQKSSSSKPSLSDSISNHAANAVEGWSKFKSWKRNGAYLRTLGGLLCIAYCFNWAIAGATIAFCFNHYTEMIISMTDTAITKTWNTLPLQTKAVILALGIAIIFFRSYVSFFLFPIQILASLCAAKLGMDLAVKNMTKIDQN
eukprot:209953_1